ncbi:MAG: FAD-binding protein [Candidatus Tectomicrobia bacterium]|nr:FAD-binding protein [Candidatus Tectomicrobia bacterium]
MRGFDRLEADVLVIGGGGAGMRAALAAREVAPRVALVSKGAIGKSGCTYLAEGGIVALSHENNPEDGYELFAADARRSGCDLAEPALLEPLAHESAERLSDLQKYGLQFRRREGGFYLRQPPGHSAARAYSTGERFGLSFSRALRDTVRECDLLRLEGVMLTELLVNDGRVCGAVGFDLRSGRGQVISAASTVLAAGGAGRLYARTNNPRDVTGDGYALAYRAGAVLQDMEFVQFYPLMAFAPFPNLFVSTGMLREGAVLRNAAGERFMLRREPEQGEYTTRDRLSRGIFLEVLEGQGIDGGVALDLSEVPRLTLEENYPRLLKACAAKNVDLRKQWLLVSPSVHFFMGGVRIDAEGRSSLPGLYAAGEICGGLHGANRLAGYALMETQVFGARAGRQAACEALARGAAKEAPEVARAALPRRERPRTGSAEEGAEIEAAESRLRQLMWKNVGIVRSAESLQAALNEIHSLGAETLPRLRATTRQQLRQLCELTNLLDVATLVTTAALSRTESRGAHFRTDFPQRDDANWLCHVALTQEQSQCVCTALPA